MKGIDPERASHYLEGLLEAMDQGVVFILTDGKVRLINAYAEELLGVSGEQMEGVSYTRLFPGEVLGIDLAEHLHTPSPSLTIYPNFSGVDLEVTLRSAKYQGAFTGIALFIRTLAEAKRSAETILMRDKKTSAPLIAESSAMKKIIESAKEVAKSSASCLITGESGTGKEIIAELIHTSSPRSDKTFIRTNCAATPEHLVESEFFGHERGAFTGASQKRLGRFERAHMGTLLLDEITEFPLHLQPKLLRAVQEQTFERVGGNKPIEVDVRLIATSNRPIREELGERMREDLYYRLSVVHLHLPPLRERKEDILPLAVSYLNHFCLENHKSPKSLSKEAEKTLLAYDWPGNVRELANRMERCCVLTTPDTLEPRHLF